VSHRDFCETLFSTLLSLTHSAQSPLAFSLETAVRRSPLRVERLVEGPLEIAFQRKRSLVEGKRKQAGCKVGRIFLHFPPAGLDSSSMPSLVSGRGSRQRSLDVTTRSAALFLFPSRPTKGGRGNSRRTTCSDRPPRLLVNLNGDFGIDARQGAAVQTHRGANPSLRSAAPALPSQWGAARCQRTQDRKNRSHTGVMIPTKEPFPHEEPLLGARGRYRTWTTQP